ncbi:outer membrane protein [Mariprofundus ferrooxydans]|uniref:outer membrane protein n=1 Tax=Mariprofundus ferrooxydans TaxID=314344 RepID=UPI0003603798|nr:outer membrane beta-barrel protein [Mariprofundus ferrooxydans]
MKKIVFYMSMFSIFFSATALHAQEVKVYAALGAGAYTLKYSESGPARAFSTKKTALPAGILRLGVDYGYLGAEIRVGVVKAGSGTYGAGTLGSASPFNLKLQASPFISYLAKFQYPVSKSFNTYLLLGGTAAKLRITPTATGLFLNSNKTKTGFTYGIGVEYKPRPLFAVGLEWIQYWTDVKIVESGGNQSKASFGGFGLSFRRSFD